MNDAAVKALAELRAGMEQRLAALLAVVREEGRREGLEEGASALEKEAAFLESRIGYAREASIMRDAESLLRVLAQPEPTPDDGDGAPI